MKKFQIGTPECGWICAAAGAVAALMILFLGFWSTVFVAALAAAGYFLGAVEDKGECVKKLINKIIPPKGE